MSETLVPKTFDDTFSDTMPGQTAAFEAFVVEHIPAGQPSQEINEPSSEFTKAYYGEWLKRRGIENPDELPHISMDLPAYLLFRNAPPGYLAYAKECYGIPQGDQDDCRYAFVDVVAGDSGTDGGPKLMVVTDEDFGTVVDLDLIASDFARPSSDPNDPSSPERPGGALKTVDISETLVASEDGLERYARTLMKGETANPFSTYYGDIGVRAGGLAPGQKDAFVWTASPLSNSLALTVAFPKQYDSVCIVRGEMREAINGKAGMAQVDNPTEVLKIEGENLEALQRVYQALYSQPDFALTEAQKQQRDELLNNHLVELISYEARINEARRNDEQYRRQKPQLRERQIPR